MITSIRLSMYVVTCKEEKDWCLLYCFPWILRIRMNYCLFTCNVQIREHSAWLICPLIYLCPMILVRLFNLSTLHFKIWNIGCWLHFKFFKVSKWDIQIYIKGGLLYCCSHQLGALKGDKCCICVCVEPLILFIFTLYFQY